jgi:hypothetical protein
MSRVKEIVEEIEVRQRNVKFILEELKKTVFSIGVPLPTNGRRDVR